MRDLPGQKAVTEAYPTRPLLSKTISHRKFTDHTRLKLRSNADNRNTKECEKQKHYRLQKMQKFDKQETQTSGLIFLGNMPANPGMPIRPHGFGLAPDSEPCFPVAEELKTFTGISKKISN